MDNDAGTTGKKVLLVEDNLHNRRIFARILSHYGYQVVEAVNGVEAVEKTQSLRPDLVLCVGDLVSRRRSNFEQRFFSGTAASRFVSTLDG